MPTTDNLPHLTLRFHSERAVDLGFDAPELSSDGGLVLVRALDERVGTTQSIARVLSARRAPNLTHTTLDLVRQRIYQIACGYEDANDASRLRFDPLLRAMLGRGMDERPLASQPTLCRFENAATLRDVVRMQRAHEQRWLASLSETMEVLVLDFDGTDDPTHGQQQLAFFNTHYGSTIYAPLMVFDQDGRLVSVRMRPGNMVLAQFAAPMIERLVRLVRARFPQLPILVRADAGFSTATVINRLHRLDQELGSIDYLIGLKNNPAVRRGCAPVCELAESIAKGTKCAAVLYDRFIYHSEHWDRAYFVVAKASHDGRVGDTRCVLTTIDAMTPSRTYERLYTDRGDAENRIKDFKRYLHGDRLSCHRFAANAFRLQLHAAAYELMHSLREEVMQVIEQDPSECRSDRPAMSHSTLATETAPRRARWQFNTLRERLLKVAAYVRQSVRRFSVQLPRAFPLAAVFRQTALRLGAS